MVSEATTRAAPDYDEIVRVVHLYTGAFNARDGGPTDGPDPLRVAMLREAFHEDAWIFYLPPDGTLRPGLIGDRFDRYAGPAPDGRRITGRVISVTQAGDVASVLLGFDSSIGPAESYVDSLNLLRINGAWKITNKTATHSSRAGGA